MDNLWIIYGYGWWLRKNPSEKYESQLGMMTFPKYGTIKNDPNHQPDMDHMEMPGFFFPGPSNLR